MRRRRGLNSAILLLLFSRLRFNSRNPSKQELHPQTDPPNAASAASFNPKTDSAIIENALGDSMRENRKLAAILAADVVGYSRLAGVDEDRTLARLRALRSDLIDP